MRDVARAPRSLRDRPGRGDPALRPLLLGRPLVARGGGAARSCLSSRSRGSPRVSGCDPAGDSSSPCSREPRCSWSGSPRDVALVGVIPTPRGGSPVGRPRRGGHPRRRSQRVSGGGDRGHPLPGRRARGGGGGGGCAAPGSRTGARRAAAAGGARGSVVTRPGIIERSGRCWCCSRCSPCSGWGGVARPRPGSRPSRCSPSWGRSRSRRRSPRATDPVGSLGGGGGAQPDHRARGGSAARLGRDGADVSHRFRGGVYCGWRRSTSSTA